VKDGPSQGVKRKSPPCAAAPAAAVAASSSMMMIGSGGKGHAANDIGEKKKNSKAGSFGDVIAMSSAVGGKASTNHSVSNKKTKPKVMPVAAAPAAAKAVAAKGVAGGGGGDSKVRKNEDAVLRTLTWLHAHQIKEADIAFVAAMAELGSVQTKTVRVCFQQSGRLAKEGLVVFPAKGSIKATNEGLKVFGPEVEANLMLLTPQQMFDNFISALFAKKPVQKKVVYALSDGGWHSEQSLLDETGYKRNDSKGFREPISTLKKMGYIETKKEGGTKMYRLTDKAFPIGLPRN